MSEKGYPEKRNGPSEGSAFLAMLLLSGALLAIPLAMADPAQAGEDDQLVMGNDANPVQSIVGGPAPVPIDGGSSYSMIKSALFMHAAWTFTNTSSSLGNGFSTSLS